MPEPYQEEQCHQYCPLFAVAVGHSNDGHGIIPLSGPLFRALSCPLKIFFVQLPLTCLFPSSSIQCFEPPLGSVTIRPRSTESTRPARSPPANTSARSPVLPQFHDVTIDEYAHD